jgi:hypothetical protein
LRSFALLPTILIAFLPLGKVTFWLVCSPDSAETVVTVLSGAICTTLKFPEYSLKAVSICISISSVA